MPVCRPFRRLANWVAEAWMLVCLDARRLGGWRLGSWNLGGWLAFLLAGRIGLDWK